MTGVTVPIFIIAGLALCVYTGLLLRKVFQSRLGYADFFLIMIGLVVGYYAISMGVLNWGVSDPFIFAVMNTCNAVGIAAYLFTTIGCCLLHEVRHERLPPGGAVLWLLMLYVASLIAPVCIVYICPLIWDDRGLLTGDPAMVTGFIAGLGPLCINTGIGVPLLVLIGFSRIGNKRPVQSGN